MLTDLYPIVVELDDGYESDSTTNHSERSNRTSLLLETLKSSSFKTIQTVDTFASYAGDNELENGKDILAEDLSPKKHPPNASPNGHGKSRLQGNHHGRCKSDPVDNRIHGNDSQHRSPQQYTRHRKRRSFGIGISRSDSTDYRDSVSEQSSVLPTNKHRNRQFQDEYVLTQQIARYELSTIWICIHRASGRRYCAKAIDKRRFATRSDRDTALREIALYRLIQPRKDSSSIAMVEDHYSCLPRIRDIFVDEEFYSNSKIGSTNSYNGSNTNSNHYNHWYIVQDFEAGGGNLELYLLNYESDHNRHHGNEALCGSSLPPLPKVLMPESKVRGLARALLLALSELHELHICHNDLCPENILVPIDGMHGEDKNEQRNVMSPRRCNLFRRRKHQNEDPSNSWKDLKLCDLGRAFVVTQEDQETTVTDTSSTSSHLLDDLHRPRSSEEGRPKPEHSNLYYTSPEAISGDFPCGLSSDLWSVGVILFRCLSGQMPFTGMKQDRNKETSTRNNLIGLSPLSPLSPSSELYSFADSPPPPPVPFLSKKEIQHLKRQILSHNADGKFFRKHSKKHSVWTGVSREGKQFLLGLLHPNPRNRWTCDQALSHPWLVNENNLPVSSSSSIPYVPSLSAASTNHYRHHPSYQSFSISQPTSSLPSYVPSKDTHSSSYLSRSSDPQPCVFNDSSHSRSSRHDPCCPSGSTHSRSSNHQRRVEGCNDTGVTVSPKSRSLVHKLWNKLSSPVRDKTKDDVLIPNAR